MPASSLILIGIITLTSGILCSLLWPQIQCTFSLSNLTILDILVLLASLIPLYGCLGFLSQSFSFRFGGLTAPGEMFYLAVIFGSVYGAFQGYARALYAELISGGGRGGKIVWFIFDHRQEQLVSWSIGGGRHCGSNRKYQICVFIFGWDDLDCCAHSLECGRGEGKG